jgi:hypothetical protein
VTPDGPHFRKSANAVAERPPQLRARHPARQRISVGRWIWRQRWFYAGDTKQLRVPQESPAECRGWWTTSPRGSWWPRCKWVEEQASLRGRSCGQCLFPHLRPEARLKTLDVASLFSCLVARSPALHRARHASPWCRSPRTLRRRSAPARRSASRSR